jgi:hypothetical protein
MSDNNPTNKPAETVSQIFKGENSEPHHMSGLTDSAINPGAVLKAEMEIPTDTRFTVKKDYGASQIVSSSADHEKSDLIYREDGNERSDIISRHDEHHQDQVIQSGATVISSGAVFAQDGSMAPSEMVHVKPADPGSSQVVHAQGIGPGESNVVQSAGAGPIEDYAVTEGVRPDAEGIAQTEEELREQTLSKVDEMLEAAKQRGEDMEQVMQKAEQMMSRVKSISEAMKVDGALKERIRQTMLRTHQLRRRVTKAD